MNKNKDIYIYIDETLKKSPRELALVFLRYEALRKLNPRQFTELHKRNLAGEFFDEMVDKLVDAKK